MARSSSKKQGSEKRSESKKSPSAAARSKGSAGKNGNSAKGEPEPNTRKDLKTRKTSTKDAGLRAREPEKSVQGNEVGKAKARGEPRESKKSSGSEKTRRRATGSQRRADSGEARRSRAEDGGGLSGPVKLALGGSGLAIIIAFVALISSMNSGPKGANPERVVVGPPPPAHVAEPRKGSTTPDPHSEPKPSDVEARSNPEDSKRPNIEPRQDKPRDPEGEGRSDPEPVVAPVEPEPEPVAKEPTASPEVSGGSEDDRLVHFQPEGDTKTLRCTQVIDGDTLILSDRSKVRLIGINTPERGEPLYPEASALLRKLTLNKDVTIAFDRERKDQFKRTLAYVFVDGHFVNGEQVRQGFAYFYEFKPNTKYSKLILKLQRASREAKRGLWGRAIERADEYISHSRSHRYHKAGCSKLRGTEDLRWKTREEALDTGRSPCPDCKS